MTEYYAPPSEFLNRIRLDEAPLTGSEAAEANLRLLIKMMRDPDDVNRDWATFLLAIRDEIDTPEVREALMTGTTDLHPFARDNAVLGLALRDKAVALPLVQDALRQDVVSYPMLEAAAVCAHPSLIPDLEYWCTPSEQPSLDALAAKALAVCQAARDAEA